MTNVESWPKLPLREWEGTYRALHMWTQIVGKIRMTMSPPLNHWWHVTLYLNARGLTTGPIPYAFGAFEIEFDFQKHAFHICTSAGPSVSRPFQSEPVAAFYAGIMQCLASLGIVVSINPKPQEIAGPIPFDRDFADRPYDADSVNRFWRILLSTAKVMDQFRAKFIGKCSPVHFFWGSFDLACTRFSGRLAPPRHGAISGPAYSHEVCSAGFWPGGGAVDGPAYYSYTIPQPSGLEAAAIRPPAANWNRDLSEFILMYDEVRTAGTPEAALLDFFESTYNAGATLARWDRAALEI